MKAEPAKNIDEYMGDFPDDVRGLLQQIRATIKAAAPEATEAIKYGIPTFILNGNLVHFGGYKNHIGFYPAPMGIEAFEEARQYETGRGTMQFALDKPLPLDLITRIVKYRVDKNLTKAKKKAS